MPRYHGKKGIVYGSVTGTGTAVQIASINHWSLDMSTDTVEVTAFGDVNKTYVQGLKDIKGTISGFWDSADDSLFDGSDSPDGAKLYLYPSSDYPSAYFYGPAWLNASIDTASGGAITVNASFVANGAWGRRP